MKKYVWIALVICMSCTESQETEPQTILTAEPVGILSDTSDVPIEKPELENDARLRAIGPIAKHPVPQEYKDTTSRSEHRFD